jgi:hypothetical protein
LIVALLAASTQGQEEASGTYQDVPVAEWLENWTKLVLRIDFGSWASINGEYDDGEVSAIHSGGRMRVYIPLSDRLVLVPSVGGDVTVNDFGGGRGFLDSGQPAGDDPFDDLAQIQFGFGAGYRINDTWSVAARIAYESGFEHGASFSGGGRVGGGLGLGYQPFENVALTAGVGIREKFDNSGVTVFPYFDGRWDITERFRLQTEGLGLRGTAKFNDTLRGFLFAGLASDRYRLSDRDDGPAGVGKGSLRDRRARVGVGLRWELTEKIRLRFETGALVWQEYRVKDEDGDTFDKATLDGAAPFVSLYIQLRL